MKRETEFLGHIISTEGIRAYPNNIYIQDFKIPNAPKQIKSFLGLCGFYPNFYKRFRKNCQRKEQK